MAGLKGVLTWGRTRWLETWSSRKVRLTLEKPVFTFTFDDAYVSSMRLGAPILEDAGARGTYYLSLLEGERSRHLMRPGMDEDEVFIPIEWVNSLEKRGHHIGCHTYSHLSARKTTTRMYEWDAWYNRTELSRALGGKPVEHFCYPYGDITFAAKRALSRHYKTLRSVRVGINRGTVDLNCLRAFPLFSGPGARERWACAIATTVRSRAWLVFYTHGVRKHPGPGDCTPDDLAWAVRQCLEGGGQILTVAQAYDEITRR